MSATSEQSPGYQLVMLVLSVCALVSVATQSNGQIDPRSGGKLCRHMAVTSRRGDRNRSPINATN